MASSRARAFRKRRQRPALEQLAERQEEAEAERLERRGERSPDLRCLVFHVGVEQRLADDRERERHHLLMRIDRGA